MKRCKGRSLNRDHFFFSKIRAAGDHLQQVLFSSHLGQNLGQKRGKIVPWLQYLKSPSKDHFTAKRKRQLVPNFEIWEDSVLCYPKQTLLKRSQKGHSCKISPKLELITWSLIMINANLRIFTNPGLRTLTKQKKRILQKPMSCRILALVIA